MSSDNLPVGLPPPPEKHVSVECIIKHETPKALLIQLDYDVESEDSIEPTNQVWIPLGQVHSIHRVADDKAYVYMSDWIAEKKGL